MHDRLSLLSRMSNPEPQDRPPETTPRSQQSQVHQTPNLLSRMNIQQTQQMRPLSLTEEVLVECNALVEGYRKGEVSKATVYVEIQSKLTKALGDDRARSDAAFGSFIATIESHDAEIGAAARKGRAFDPTHRALLYRIQMGGSPMMRSQSPRNSRSTSQHMLGSRVGETNIPSYETPSLKRSSSLRLTPLTQKQPRGPLLMNQTVPSSPTRNGRMSSPAEQSISMPSTTHDES